MRLRNIEPDWIRSHRWVESDNPSFIERTGIYLGRENYLLQIYVGITRNIETSFEVYWGGDGRFEGRIVPFHEKYIWRNRK
ncbi:MAG: hypothetical protein L6282_01910 [Candidatus Methanoperedenaceae archaeon]|nr:hypothetical protein [Candidatus Methanoperedenaceae archaeon]